MLIEILSFVVVLDILFLCAARVTHNFCLFPIRIVHDNQEVTKGGTASVVYSPILAISV